MGIIITTIQMLAFMAYIIYITDKYNKLISVSHSWYVLPNKRKYLFTIMMWVLALGQLVHIEISEWFFLSAVGLGFVGAATTFDDDKVTYWVHYIGAIVGIVGALLGLNTDVYLLIFTALVIGWMWLNDPKHIVWDAEVFFLTLIGTLTIFKYLI